MSTQQPPISDTPVTEAAITSASHRKLSPFLKTSIVLLSIVAIASIALLFLGDFEGKFERIFSTFVLFGVFTLFTALDTRLEKRSEWYAPVALIANTYILGLALIVVWITAYDPFTLIFTIFWKSFFIIGVTRVVIIGCELLLRLGADRPAPLGVFAFLTSVLATLAGIMFTAPTGIEAFEVTIPDLYWKIAVATLILTALGLAITLLLRWNYASDERALRREVSPLVPPVSQVAAQFELLPWPLFADGTPLPADAHGQPDFSAQTPRV
jgi:hypothetical protein